MIIEMLNSEFNEFAKNASLNLAPMHLLNSMQEVNSWVYPNINSGVYRCGFAKSQEAYDEAFENLFNHLDKMEHILSKQRYLCGNIFTLSDIRAFTTLIRFDIVYVTHFKCNKKRIIDYPNIWNYVKEIYQMDNIKDTVNFEHIKSHYYVSHEHINPRKIIPKGPAIDLMQPHGRNKGFSKL